MQQLCCAGMTEGVDAIISGQDPKSFQSIRDDHPQNRCIHRAVWRFNRNKQVSVLALWPHFLEVTYYLVSDLYLNWKVLDAAILRPAYGQNLIVPIKVAQLQIDDLTASQGIYSCQRSDRSSPYIGRSRTEVMIE